jgi:DNA repair protein SbcC/Rad50
MRLLRLKLEAFGPYEDQEIVDFRALRYSKLFLIHGPVGSGKTFLLDGLCFALYGRSSGGERDRTGLRNLAATPDKETAVTLDFESQGQAYRIERRFLPENQDSLEDDVTLWRLPELMEPGKRDIVSSSRSGVSAMIVKLFGLTAEQFCQVAILPQGSFRRFLLAEGEQRRRILSNIFNSSRHAQFATILQNHHQQAKAELETAWSRREQVTSRYREFSGDPREMLQRSAEELAVVRQDCEVLQERSMEWERSLEDAVRFEVLDRQRGMTERELNLLRQDEDEDDETALAARLQECLPIYQEWKRLESQTEAIDEELQEQRAQYEQLKSNTNFLEDEVKRARLLEEERFNLKRSLERLDILVEDYRGVQALSEELSRVHERLTELGQVRSEVAIIVREQKAEILSAEEELDKIKSGEQKLASLKGDLESIERQKGRQRQGEALQDSFAQAQAREERFQQLLDRLELERTVLVETLTKQSEHDMKESLHSLKGRLEKGKPCPLCGSKEHPKPFKGRRKSTADDEVSHESLEELDHRLEIARKELVQARQRVARLEGRLEERANDVQPVPDLDDETLAGLQRTIEIVESRIEKKDELLKRLRKLRSEIKPARIKLKKMRILKERLQTTVENITSQYEEQRQIVLRTMREFFSQFKEATFEELVDFVESEKQRLDERLADIDKVEFTTERAELMAETFALQLAETRAAEMKREDYQAKADALRKQLEDSFRMEFANWDDLSFSLIRVARESSIRGESPVLDRDTLIRTVERQLHQSQELLATMPQPEMKSGQIRQVLSREREQIELKIGRRAALEKSLEQSKEDIETYDELVKEIRELEKREKSLAQMAGLANGKAGPNFHDWYLDRVFRRVITAANLRLEVLAPNRFCLGLHPGLEVKIMDFLAGKERSATTLSGGESFLASLALALGLGDILQGERDSREKLQTLFVDEGFGYLDRRAMDAAMDCLESLNQEGRTVGIISHVSALRERIRAQVVLAPNDAPLPYGVDRVQVFAE